MKNIEKYKDILFNICVKDQDHFMVTKDGDIRTCVWNKADCKDCKLYKKFISCKELRLNWLNEDFIPTFYIDKADKAFLLNAFINLACPFSSENLAIFINFFEDLSFNIFFNWLNSMLQ